VGADSVAADLCADTVGADLRAAAVGADLCAAAVAADSVAAAIAAERCADSVGAGLWAPPLPLVCGHRGGVRRSGLSRRFWAGFDGGVERALTVARQGC